jgi:hypothetical protein
MFLTVLKVIFRFGGSSQFLAFLGCCYIVFGWFLEVSEALAVAVIRAGTSQKPDSKNGKKLLQEVTRFIKLL